MKPVIVWSWQHILYVTCYLELVRSRDLLWSSVCINLPQGNRLGKLENLHLEIIIRFLLFNNRFSKIILLSQWWFSNEMRWIHCNTCFLLPGRENVQFHLTSCGHIFCTTCLNKSKYNAKDEISLFHLNLKEIVNLRNSKQQESIDLLGSTF